MSDFGISRRLKRVRSVSANGDLDAELQSSIRRQNNASKRSRIASAGSQPNHTRSQQPGHASWPADRADLPESAPSDERLAGLANLRRADGRETQSSFRSLWTSMSGFFVKDRAQPGVVRETVDAYEALQGVVQQSAYTNSPRDSGIYLDSRPSSRPKPDAGSIVEKADLPFSLDPPQFPTPHPADSPLKRLQTASKSGLRKVKSLAFRKQPSREDLQSEQREMLMKKMSNLQSQLNECKQEFAQLFGGAENVKEHETRLGIGSSPASPRFDRGTQTAVGLATSTGEHTYSPQSLSVHPSIEPAEHAALFDRSPSSWPLPKKIDVDAQTTTAPSLRRKPNIHALRTPEPQLQPESGTEALLERAMNGNVENFRRSLSTIPSSGDEMSPPSGHEKELQDKEPKRATSTRSARNSRIPIHSPQKTSRRDENKSLFPMVIVPKDVTTSVESPRTLRSKRQNLGENKPLKKSISPKKVSSSKKVVGDERLGHYEESGEWVWGSETF